VGGGALRERGGPGVQEIKSKNLSNIFRAHF